MFLSLLTRIVYNPDGNWLISMKVLALVFFISFIILPSATMISSVKFIQSVLTVKCLSAGLGYNLMVLSAASGLGLLREGWPWEWMAVNKIRDNMGRIRLNETNLLLLFEK